MCMLINKFYKCAYLVCHMCNFYTCLCVAAAASKHYCKRDGYEPNVVFPVKVLVHSYNEGHHCGRLWYQSFTASIKRLLQSSPFDKPQSDCSLTVGGCTMICKLCNQENIVPMSQLLKIWAIFLNEFNNTLFIFCYYRFKCLL